MSFAGIQHLLHKIGQIRRAEHQVSGEGLLLISRRDSRTSKVFNKLDHFNVSNKLDYFLAKKLGHFSIKISKAKQ